MITPVPKAELWVMGDFYRQYREAVGPELVARSADATASTGTNEHGDVEAGIRDLQYSPRRSPCLGEA